MLEEIYGSALKLLTPKSLEETYATGVNEAVRLARADFGTLFLEQNGELLKVYSNFPKFITVVPRKNGYTYKAFTKGKSYVLPSKTLARAHPDLIENGIKSIVIIPLLHDEQAIGVLTLQTKNVKEFSKENIDSLKIFTSLLTLAIEKNRLYTDARNAVRMRDLFISMAAHELRTPTTTIQGYVQLMKKNYEKGRRVPGKWLEILYAETIRLNNLLKELLKVEQIKRGQLKYEWKKNSLKEIIDRALAYAKVTHTSHKVIFQNQMKHRDLLYSDFDKLLQVIITLINNSAKFSEPGTTVTIEADSVDSYFRIKVKDQGMGISKRDIPHIFEGFYKGRDNTKAGLGLGLFLAEQIVQRHHGFMSVASKRGKGTIVEINLPKN